jgi:hypothetical protein
MNATACMRTARRLLTVTMIAAVLPAAALAANTSRGAQTDDFAWSGRVAPGKAVEIKGINGGISAEPASGNEVEITAVKHWRHSDPDEVRIEVIPHDGGITICTVYPTPRGEREENRCEPGDDGHMNTRNNDVSVEYRVRIPAGVRLIARTVNGRIDARGIDGDAEATTVNGDVRVWTRGIATATTVNGSIDVEMGRSLDEPLDFNTVNGGITLQMPSKLGAELHAATLNGDIDSDFDLNAVRGMVGRPGHRHKVVGTIGRGGPRLSISTVNGDIRLRSGS